MKTFHASLSPLSTVFLEHIPFTAKRGIQLSSVSHKEERDCVNGYVIHSV